MPLPLLDSMQVDSTPPLLETLAVLLEGVPEGRVAGLDPRAFDKYDAVLNYLPTTRKRIRDPGAGAGAALVDRPIARTAMDKCHAECLHPEAAINRGSRPLAY